MTMAMAMRVIAAEGEEVVGDDQQGTTKRARLTGKSRPHDHHEPRIDQAAVGVPLDLNLFRFEPIIEDDHPVLFDTVTVNPYLDDGDDSDWLSLALNAASNVSASKKSNSNFIDLTQEEEEDDVVPGDCDDEIQVLSSKPANTTFRKRKRGVPFSGSPVFEIGQSSNHREEVDEGRSFFCEICVEWKARNESFCVDGCGHCYCSDCVARYVASKLQDNVLKVGCPVPNCKGSLGPELCRPILSKEVFDRWEKALREAEIIGSGKYLYCPYKDCSLLLVIDNGDGAKKRVGKESKCPNCRRLYCAECKAAWHKGIDCLEFQKLNKDEREKEDFVLVKLAQKRKWQRCPTCNFFVARTQGCLHIACRSVCFYLEHVLNSYTRCVFVNGGCSSCWCVTG